MRHDSIIILDFGSQYTQLISQVVRSQSVLCWQLPWNVDQNKIEDINPKGIILSGGPASIYSSDAPQLPPFLLHLGIPLLGICYGMQALALLLEGEVVQSQEKEYGKTTLKVDKDNPLLPKGAHIVWMSHGDKIKTLPPGFEVYASTENSPIAAMGDPERGIYGVQFHPEVKHTPAGEEIINNFLQNICRASPTWSPDSIIEQSVHQIREKVGKSCVLSAVSGGVDSSVATALVHQAVGDQLDCVFVDTGLLRKEEGKRVKKAFESTLGIQLRMVSAGELFYKQLIGITDPEEKRKIIGNLFIQVFEDQAQQLGHPQYLVQGTIYPDVVESTAPDRAGTDTIKTHHNVGGLPENLRFKLIEPLRYLFKDEVRKIGTKMGLPDSLIWRQPFPGPGLAIRCLGEVTPKRIERLRAADDIFISELKRDDLLKFDITNETQGTSQCFAVLLPVKSVGVMGDQRTYEDVIALRAVTTDDFMTADWARLPDEILARIANRIVNEVPGINRVVYDITSKPPGTIEWE
jgi:GMP synthase (glutamine-hydrolysing)